MECTLRYALDIFGQKWKLPIIWYLYENETTRFNELKRKTKGITNVMLTKSLRELEENNLVIRKQYNTIPSKVEYSLSQRGKDLLPVLNELNSWGEKQIMIDREKDNI
ncbi:winged helix-turn-helix transcriptional regulator [Terrisporobacter sp.]|uniref:winged helix-turn-helix transcriptional regulator n=1 Tax=Terrisporobacter sp. TaxID=1965305 RepID=UPI002F94761F